MITTAPFPLALGSARPPALIAAAEKYFRDRALVFAVAAQGQAPHVMRDLVTGAIPTTLSATKAVGYSPLGVGMTTDAANSGPVWGTPPAMPSTFANATMVWVGVPASTAAVVWMMTFGNSAGNPYLSIAYDGTNGAFRYFENSYLSTANGTAPTGPVYVVVITKAGTAKKIYINGVLLGSNSAGSATQTAGGVALGRIVASPGTVGPGTHCLGALWSRTFSDAEVSDLSVSMLRSVAQPRRFRPQYTPIASGGTNVLTDTGVLTVAGFAPTTAVSNNQNVLSGVGAATLSGFAPTVTASGNQNVLAGLGVVTLTGFAPTVTASGAQNVLPGVGLAVLSGFAPSVATTNNRNVLPGVGAAVLSGFAPTVFATNPVNVLPGRGVLSLTGFAPTATVSTAGVPALGRTSFTLTASRSSTAVVASRSAILVRNSDLN